MLRRVLTDRSFLVVAIAAFFFELVSVATTFSTMGHAGPEGRGGILGWIALVLNMPGLALSSLWGSPSDSMLWVAARVFISQFVLICGVAFIIRYLSLRGKPE